MADITNTSAGNVFKSFGNAPQNQIKRPSYQPKTVTTPSTAVIVKEEPAKTSKLEKAMPYIATGAAVAAVGASTVAIVTANKNTKATKALLNEVKTLKETISSGSGVPVDKETFKSTTSFLVGILGAATGGAIVNHFDNNKDTLKKVGMSDDEIKNSRLKAELAANERESRVSNATNTAKEAVDKAQNAENKVNEVSGKAEQAIGTANEAINRANSVSNKEGVALAIHRKPYYGLNLMVIDRNEKYVNQKKLDSALTDIHTAVNYRNGRKPGQTEDIISNYRKKYSPLMQSNSTWSITAEYDPIKAGGLGSVPMEIHNNFADMGIDNPVFIPMYQQKGNSEFIEYGSEKDGKKYKYIYGGETFDVEKMAEMPVQQVRGNKVVSQKVEFFLGHAKRKDINGKAFANPDQPIVFVKNVDNFGGDIYANNINADEPEKFAFLSKAVYQLAEAKVATALGEKKTGLGELKIVNQKAYDEIKPPVGMMLNDWHAAPMAGLLRYKAPMENAYNVISDKTKDALRDMPLIMVGHNAGIPGGTRSHSKERSDMLTESIINTLYDGYAFGIVENATTDRQPDSVGNSIVWDKTDDENRRFCNLAHGIALSDFYIPVSKNYEKELKDGVQKSDIAFDIINARKASGSIVGIINGLDRDGSSTEAKAGWLKNAFGIDLQTYNHHTPIDDVMAARQHNKMELYDKYVTPIMNGATTLGGKNLNVIGEPMKVSRDDFEKAPVLVFAHRLSDQKGIDIFQKAVKELFNTWDKKHPGQPKPVIIAGGQLEEAKLKPYLHELKNPNNYDNKDDNNRIMVLEGFMPNPALMAAATYFNAPSTFEPCGLTQGECYAMGTPIITTATGGFVDTIIDGKNGFVAPYKSYFNEVETIGNEKEKQAKRETWLNETGHSLAEKMHEGLDLFFNKPDEYKQIVSNNLNENLSWNRGKDDDAIHNHMAKLGIYNEDIIEAEVAPVRQFIVPILKAFDALDKGKLNAASFNSNFVKTEDNHIKHINQDKVFGQFENKNDSKQDQIEATKNTINGKIETSQSKINLGVKADIETGKIEGFKLRLNTEEAKLDRAKAAASLVENDKKMLNKLLAVYAAQTDFGASGNKFNMNAEELKDVNEWKQNLYSKYAA